MSFLTVLSRDLSTVTNDLLGRRSPPFARRAALGRHHHVIASAHELLAPRTVTIAKITRETRDAVTLELDATVDFRAGQFLTVMVEIDGVEHRRAYSLCTAPHEGRVAVTVKKLGLVSSYLNERARVGDRLRILGPSGSFGDAATGDEVVLIGGGSGVTPLMSIARSVLHRNPRARISLILGNRTREDVIFYDALGALESERFSVEHVFGDRFVAELPVSDGHYFLCGPAPMMAATREQLLGLGVPRTRIHEETFSSPTQKKTRLPTASQRITIGAREATATPGQTLLEAGLSAGISMPFSCTMGGCGACRVKLLAGDVEMEEPTCLTAAEREEGYVLACVARAHSPVAIEVG